MRATEERVSGQTSFESPIHFHRILSSLKCSKTNFFFIIPLEKVRLYRSFFGRGETGDKVMNWDWQERDRRRRNEQLGHSGGAVDWFGTSWRSLCRSQPPFILESQTIHLLSYTTLLWLFLEKRHEQQERHRQKRWASSQLKKVWLQVSSLLVFYWLSSLCFRVKFIWPLNFYWKNCKQTLWNVWMCAVRLCGFHRKVGAH